MCASCRRSVKLLPQPPSHPLPTVESDGFIDAKATEGIIPHAVAYIFKRIEERGQSHGSVRVKATFCEVYNEKVQRARPLWLHSTPLSLPLPLRSTTC